MSRKKSPKTPRQSATEATSDRDFKSAIADLPDTIRWIVILGERDGLSSSEIAKLAGVSESLVEAMRQRGLALIQTELEMVARKKKS